jgi:hypothetical protein
MKSRAMDAMPLPVRRALKKLGGDIALARRARALTMAMMADRTSIALSTYQRIEKGDPAVAFGLYAMVLFSLGVGDRIGSLLDPGTDDVGLLLGQDRLPKRVTRPKQDEAL